MNSCIGCSLSKSSAEHVKTLGTKLEMGTQHVQQKITNATTTI